MLSNIKVAVLDEEQRIWFVRSEGGTYAPHFRSGNLIATDHLSKIFGERGFDRVPTHQEIRTALLSNDKFSEFRFVEKEKRELKFLNLSGSKILAAIAKFTDDIQIGDMVLTKTAFGGFMFGICSSDAAYASTEPVALSKSIVQDASSADTLQMSFTLRKKVVWGPIVPSHEIPDSLKNSLARNTLTELTHLKEMIYHLLYPFFTDGAHLYFSNKIRSEDAVNSAVIGKLFQNISMVGLLTATILNEEKIDAAMLIKAVESSIFSNLILSTSKADFMSPGDTWSKILLSGPITPKMLATAVLSCLLLTGIVSVYEMENAIAGVAGFTQEITMPVSANQEASNNENTGLFGDKFKDAEDVPTPALDSVKEALRRQHEAINELTNTTYAKEINNALKLELLQPKTAKLEADKFGIKIHELGSR